MLRKSKSSLTSLILGSLVLISSWSKADFKDDIDFPKLKAEYGASLPNGSGIRLLQVEYVRYGLWAPATQGELAGKIFTNIGNTFGGASSHANEVGAFLGGVTSSITPGIEGWQAMEATNYYYNTLHGENYLPPEPTNWEIENHSWGGTSSTNPESVLQKLDYRIERDNVTVLVGMDNGASLSDLLANAYNVIAVGTSTGNHPRTKSTIDGKGRLKPDLVGTATWTSYATPIVTSCAELLLGEAKRTASLTEARSPLVIKALLMAGATKSEFPAWTNSPSQPLDVAYGAGEVNIYNSYKALVAGRQISSSSSLVKVDGWDKNTTSTSSRKLYYFNVPAGQKLTLSTVLNWYCHVQPNVFTVYAGVSYWQNGTRNTPNLDLVLWNATSGYALTSEITRSASTIDNVEHIYRQSLPAGTYALEVIAPVNGESYALAWKGTLESDGSVQAPVVTTPEVPATSTATPPASSTSTTTPTTPTETTASGSSSVLSPVATTPVSVAVGDNSFENSAIASNGFWAFVFTPAGSSWTFQGSSGISTNGCGYTLSNPNAPAGKQVAMLQGNGGSISQNVAFSAAGTFTLWFNAAQRANYQSSTQDFQVLIDGSVVGTFTPTGVSYGTYQTAAFTVAAGSHEIKFLGLNSKGGDNTALIDYVTIEATATSPASTGSTFAPVVTAPAKVVPVLGDSGFENPAISTSGFWAFILSPTGSSWNFQSSGVAANSSGYTLSNPNAPEGKQVAVLQGNGSFSQSVTFAAGTYSIWFEAAQRANYQASKQNFQVLVDGSVVGTFTPSGAAYATYQTAQFTVTAGMHEIKFVGLNSNGGDNTALVDDISVE